MSSRATGTHVRGERNCIADRLLRERRHLTVARRTTAQCLVRPLTPRPLYLDVRGLYNANDQSMPPPQHSRLRQALDSGRFVITSELSPPKGTDLTRFLAKAERLEGAVDAVNVTDSHAAHMTLSPVVAGHRLLEAGVEPILQLTTRDRNRIALQGDLLGAYVLGVRNVVVMGGDPPAGGDHPDAKPVFDLYAAQLLEAVSGLARGTDYGGNDLTGNAELFAGAVVNPGAADIDEEVRRMQEKYAAGARFFQTQAVYDVEAFARFVASSRDVEAPLLAGIIPVKSRTMAEYMNSRVPGIEIPEPLIAEIDGATDKRAASVAMAGRIAGELRDFCAGLHIMTIGWEDEVQEIARAARGA
ncbi:MAG: methylenetetrahydrofolate reductase [Gammaproteobacteria bacterium]